jgi:hypothetical protein
MKRYAIMFGVALAALYVANRVAAVNRVVYPQKTA